MNPLRINKKKFFLSFCFMFFLSFCVLMCREMAFEILFSLDGFGTCGAFVQEVLLPLCFEVPRIIAV